VKFFGTMHNNFNQAEYDEACKQATGSLALVEKALDGKQYLVGDTLSIADIAVYESV
jgi:glutathionyl-hydroquinone reductase